MPASAIVATHSFVNAVVYALQCAGHILSLELQFSDIIDNLRQLVDPVV